MVCTECDDIKAEVSGLRSFLNDWFTAIIDRFDAHERRMEELLCVLAQSKSIVASEHLFDSNPPFSIQAAKQVLGDDPRHLTDLSLPYSNGDAQGSSFCYNDPADFDQCADSPDDAVSEMKDFHLSRSAPPPRAPISTAPHTSENTFSYADLQSDSDGAFEKAEDNKWCFDEVYNKSFTGEPEVVKRHITSTTEAKVYEPPPISSVVPATQHPVIRHYSSPPISSPLRRLSSNQRSGRKIKRRCSDSSQPAVGLVIETGTKESLQSTQSISSSSSTVGTKKTPGDITTPTTEENSPSPSKMQLICEPGDLLTPDNVCTICGKKLSMRGNGLKHVKLHIFGKTLQCPHCPNKFSQSSNLKNHVLARHIKPKRLA